MTEILALLRIYNFCCKFDCDNQFNCDNQQKYHFKYLNFKKSITDLLLIISFSTKPKLRDKGIKIISMV